MDFKKLRKQKIFPTAKLKDKELKIYGFRFKEWNISGAKAWLDKNCKDELFKIKEEKGYIKATHYRIEIDHQGEHEVTEQPNGVSIRILKKPSEEYKAKLKARAEKQEIQNIKEKEQREKEKLINAKIRELAISELEKEGKI